MLSNMLDKAVNPLGLRGIYSLFAALMCICAVGGGFGLWATPLETMSRILDFLSIPTDWISGVETYLGEDNARNELFGTIAALLAIAVVRFLTPNPDVSRTEVPSVQSATWWICVAICAQIPIASLWLPVGLTIAWLLVQPIIGKYRRYMGSKSSLVNQPVGRTRTWERSVLDIVQLCFVIAGIFLLIYNFVLMDVPLEDDEKKNTAQRRLIEKQRHKERKKYRNTPPKTQQRVMSRKQK